LRVVELAAALAGTCAALGKFARDITLLAQTEVAEVHENASGGRGGSSAMPHKRNPVAAITILGCTKQAPGLLSTLTAAAEQEHQRAAGAWHSEWQPLSHLLTLTGSAASWSSELLSGLQIDPPRMRANLDATNSLPMAEHITQLLAPVMGRLQAHDLLAKATATATATNTNLADALLTDATSAPALADAGITPTDLQSALRPESYLGATNEFIKRALAAHASTEEVLRS
jgi:3-carboxy-cis,cis-muconate cycloisomerase